MSQSRPNPTPDISTRSSAQVKPKVDDGPEVVPAEVEVRSEYGPIPTRDDEKIYETETHAVASPTSRKRYCGLSKRNFLLVLAASGLVIVAIAVGIGVGVSKHKSSQSQPSSDNDDNNNNNATSTTSQPPTLTTKFISQSNTATNSPTSPSYTCENGTTYTSSNNTPFKILCDHDLGVGEDHNTYAADLPKVDAMATFAACMDVCATDRSQGIQVDGVDGGCRAVVWNSNSNDKSGYQDCWLKNATALIGNKDPDLVLEHSVPIDFPGLQAADIVGL